ncbi:MAG: uncharacterized protein PWR24_1659 [Desulfonauticus sp.]|jgi:hypothetical protein|nr:uncharacterized protein [Desulfonauticus sp.]
MNLLAQSKNLYLQQHKDNPIFWQPWGEKALLEAREKDKPIFLSIGYSSCHWCHVMARESFSDKKIAEILNENFVCIKVDREERVDLDTLYMQACYVLNGYGGWPLNLFLTPEKKPFLAFTYLPKENLLDRVGFKELVKRISILWKRERKMLEETALELENVLKQQYLPVKNEFTGQELELALTQLKEDIDWEFGGLGKAPKFFLVPSWLFLSSIRDREEFGSIVKKTLRHVARGGVFDQIGGGFFRYSVDREWKLPHFEKMLYDQALNLLLFLRGYKLFGEDIFLRTIEKTLNFCFQKMQAPNNGFFSSLSAESEGKEGRYYLWRAEELEKTLSKSEFSYLKEISKIEDKGNFKEEASGSYTGENIIFLSPEKVGSIDLNKLDKIFAKLLLKREEKVLPEIDRKILCDYNSLFLFALCEYYQLFPQEKIKTAIKNLFFFLKDTFYIQDELYHSFIEGEIGSKGTAYDYTYFLMALSRVYWLFKEEFVLDLILRLLDKFWELFADEDIYLSSKGSQDLFLRPKQYFDNTLISPLSALVYTLLFLYRLKGKDAYLHKVKDILQFSARNFTQYPANYSFVFFALREWDFLEPFWKIS